jgi:cytochrome P450
MAQVKPMPGPGMLSAISGLRRQGFLSYIDQAWRTYGDTFQLRFGPRSLILAIHPEAVRQVSITNRQNYDKVASYDGVRRYLVGDGLIASTGDLWRRQRKLMSPFFTPRGVLAFTEIMLSDGRRLVERWDQLARAGQPVEMSKEMTLVTAAIILKALFSTESDDAIADMKDAVETLIAFVNNNQAGLRLPLWVPTRANREYQAAHKQVYTYINALVASRRALPEAQWPNDLLTHLMQARDDETGASMAEHLLRNETITLFFAGHETTARTMTATWYALASHPAVAQRLHAELDAVLGGRHPTLEDLHHLPYTLQVVKEVLRLYPAAPVYVRDALAADKIDGYPVPAGAAVMLAPYFTHRHPEFWENPLAFDPDRWTPEREAARHPYAYHPFASGQRICLGNNFSLLESHILLALLGRRFAPRLQPGYDPQWVMRGVLALANGLPMHLTPRPLPEPIS